MHVIFAKNVSDGLIEGLAHLHDRGIGRDSRNGPVYQTPHQVATVYSKPTERVLFYPWRDANPFFHFYEALWMLAGRNDIAPLVKYVKRMESFSDDGITFRAAYGHRWRHTMDPTEYGRRDQLKDIVANLQANPDDRRQVLQIWDHARDLAPTVSRKDIACNIAATFQVSHQGSLEMTVFCRSNDIIWGCYGANAVHFSMLQEYIARAAGFTVGAYTQISVNFHAYSDLFVKCIESPDVQNFIKNGILAPTPYDAGKVKPYPLMYVTQDEWDEDVSRFITRDGRAPRDVKFHDPFFNDVALPLVMAHDCYQDGDWQAAIDLASIIEAEDWRRACVQWLERRRK